MGVMRDRPPSRRWSGQTAIPVPDRSEPGRSLARRNRHNGRRTGGSGSRGAEPAASRYAHRPAAGFATRRGVPLRLRAGAQQSVDRSIGVRMRPADAGAAPTRRAIRRSGREVLLLALRRRLRRIAGGLRWPAQFVEPRFEHCDTGVLRGDVGVLDCDPPVSQRQPSGQRRDQRVLLEVAQLGGRGEQRHPMARIDSPVTASRSFWG